MKITIWGAARQVTGSSHLIEFDNKRVLLDCGLFQGGKDARRLNSNPLPFEVPSLDAVILSHAHIDHSGRLPLLMRHGFRGRIYASRATRDLCRIMLKDSAFIQEKNVEWNNRKRARKHLPPIEPLYSQDDAIRVMRRFRGFDFGTAFQPVKGLRAILHPAGHILGASSVEISDASGRRMIFSGDLGPNAAPLLPPPWQPDKCDLLLVESTYGDRLHRSLNDTWKELGGIISNAKAEKGNILIPAFAVGRTQQILHAFHEHFHTWGLDRWRIFLDSPLAVAASEIHDRHAHLIRTGAHAPAAFLERDNVHVMRTASQSMAINKVRSGAIIIAGSGMCDGGRIMHHLKHNLWRKNCHVLIVGFQAGGTLGRRLVDGAKRVSLFGEAISVGAKVHTIGGLSAHADQNDLVEWITAARGHPKVVIVHGEARSQDGLISALRRRGASEAVAAEMGQTFNI